MTAIRRHLSTIGIAWLLLQGGVLAISPLVPCCAAAQNAVDDDDCCKGMAPGQLCPLHKHRHAPTHDTHHDDASGGCAVRSGCTTLDPALVSLTFGLGVLETPVSLDGHLVSIPVPSRTVQSIDRARSLDPPPPRS